MKLNLRSDERGFTIIEVLVAAFLLVLGVMGTVTMIDTANGVTNNNKAREGATNLAREIIEVARSLPYDQLDNTDLKGALQAQPGLADANAATTAWEIKRRGGSNTGPVTYTVEVNACTMDDGKDGGRVVGYGGSFCSGSVNEGTLNAKNQSDSNPDDFRRVEVDIKWSNPGRTASSCKGQAQTLTGTGAQCVQQSTLIPNPNGGLGPSVRSSTIHIFPCYSKPTATTLDNCPTELTSPNNAEPLSNGSPVLGVRINFDTAQSADVVSWASSDSVQTNGTATARGGDVTGKNWTLDYVFPNSIPDGTYTVTITPQLLGAAGTPGDATFPLNNNVPAAPDVTNIAPISFGYNTRLSAQPVVEVVWAPGDTAFDINGYRLMSVNNEGANQAPSLTGSGHDRLVPSCGPATAVQTVTNCYDDAPPGTTGVWNYYVLALDDQWATAGLAQAPTNCTAMALASQGGASFGNVTIDETLFSPNRAGCPSRVMSVDIGTLATNKRPQWTTANTPTISGSPQPTIDWSTSVAVDPDAATAPGIAFYRIYRTTTPITDQNQLPYSARIGSTNGSGVTQTNFKDTNPIGAAYYYVTAVDNQLQESDFIGPVAFSG